MKYLALLVASSQAFAEAAPAAGPANQISAFLPLLLMVGVFYFLVIRPQTKRQKEHQKFITGLKRGDMVVTQSGIIGTIKTVNDKFVTLEVDENVHLKVVRSQIAESATSLKETRVATTAEATT